MTLQGVARFNHCEVRIEKAEVGFYFIARVLETEEEITRVHCRANTAVAEHRAARDLNQKIFNMNSQNAYERAGFKCEECGALGPLHPHHRVFRSHGVDNSVENIKALCARCHAAAHGIKIA